MIHQRDDPRGIRDQAAFGGGFRTINLRKAGVGGKARRGEEEGVGGHQMAVEIADQRPRSGVVEATGQECREAPFRKGLDGFKADGGEVNAAAAQWPGRCSPSFTRLVATPAIAAFSKANS